MKKEIENYQRKLKLSGSLMEIYPAVEATTHEEFLLKVLSELYEDREQKRKDALHFEILESEEFIQSKYIKGKS